MLWLLRHAEAADGSPDADRPLTLVVLLRPAELAAIAERQPVAG